MKFLVKTLQSLLGLAGITVLRRASFRTIQRNSVLGVHKILWLLNNSPHSGSFESDHRVKILNNSRSQLGQDVFALSYLGADRSGYFVEFGATNGKDFSNTYLLEKYFGWTGILCEPGRFWNTDLKKNRSAKIDTRCVYSESNLKLRFIEDSIPVLSRIYGLGGENDRQKTQSTSSSYEVESVSLLDLLDFHDAPKHIDFLSVDTEGSELEILSAFDFSRYTFGAIAVEHNYTPSRAQLKALLESKGYRQVHSELSDFDDWFVLDDKS